MPVGVVMGGRGSPSPAVLAPKGLLRMEQLNQLEREKFKEDWSLPVYNPKEEEEIEVEDPSTLPRTFRPQERLKTNTVALVMCLNLGVDPPDVVKISPCARMECWIDPMVHLAKTAPQKVLEQIGTNLQKQYERWQAKARYKQALDPTLDDVKKLCISLRKSAKDERVLFHYNGHGVPKPTHNGEIWVFNKSYTQYIPLSLYDLLQWMGSPSIYVYDCSGAGILLLKCQAWMEQHQRDYDQHLPHSAKSTPVNPPSFENCIQLAACREDEVLPMDPNLPADIFTSCLTTPINMALRCYVLNSPFKLVPDITLESVENLPGALLDRKTMLGELNWIFTAITDTIAWNVLPKPLFQKLFRQDLLVASLFRNFLLAERIMRIYDCNPQSNPSLPKTYQHPMWQAWDLALDSCLRQLPDMLKNGTPFSPSKFFAEQLTSFELWLRFSPLDHHHAPPEQLPIVLQILLSQVLRLRALELLGTFLDFGPWAVSQALSVGIFPYILKLLQSQAKELRPFLVFIWAKILAVDCSYQVDLVRENSHKYFLSMLQDTTQHVNIRAMSAFILSCFCANGYHIGQKSCIQNHVVAACTELLSGEPLTEDLKKWICILLGRLWDGYCEAKWLGIRSSTHERLIPLLQDPSPEVRAAAVFALGTLLNSQTQRTDHADTTDSNIGIILVTNTQWDASPMVRQELIVALQWLFCVFDTQYVTAAYKSLIDEGRGSDMSSNSLSSPMTIKHNRVKSATNFFVTSIIDGVRTSPNTVTATCQGVIATEQKLRRISSGSSLSSQAGLLLPTTIHSQHTVTWKFMNAMATFDPHEKVGEQSNSLVGMYKTKAESMISTRRPSRDHLRGSPTPSTAISNTNNTCHSEPSSPSGMNSFIGCNTDDVGTALTPLSRSSSMFHSVRMCDAIRSISPAFSQSRVVRPRRTFEKSAKVNGAAPETCYQLVATPVVSTKFLDIVTKQFRTPNLKDKKVDATDDHNSREYCTAEFRFMRNATVRRQAWKTLKSEGYKGLAKAEEQQFTKKMTSPPTSVVFHPFEPLLFVSDHQQVTIFDTDRMTDIDQIRIAAQRNLSPRNTSRISSTVLVNAHHDRCLLFSASTDGAIRAWANTCTSSNSRNKPEISLITGFNCMLDAPDIQTSIRCSGIILDWDQSRSQLITCGDMKVVRIWDMNQERRILDMPVDADISVRCVSVDKSTGGSLIAVGLMDGSVKLYDQRRPYGTCKPIFNARDHCGQVVGIHLDAGGQTLTSASVAGDIRCWQLSGGTQNHSENRYGQIMYQDLTCMAVHPYFPGVIACGTQTQNIVVLEEGTQPQVVKAHHEWFSGQKTTAAVNTLAFHPYKMSLAVASQDNSVSLYQRKRS